MKGTVRKEKRRRSGVTLLEILVAMVVLTGGLFMVYNIFPRGFATAYRSKNKTIAIQLAQRKMEEILQQRKQINCKRPDAGSNCKFVPPTTFDDGQIQVDHDCNPLTATVARTWAGTNPWPAGTYSCGYNYSLGLPYDPPANHPADSTRCIYDMGVMDNTVASLNKWKSFPENPLFWYFIQVIPVLDPSHSLPAQTRLSLYRDWGACSRITVYVRGPVENMTTQWPIIITKQSDRLPSHVALTTFLANKALGSTHIRVGTPTGAVGTTNRDFVNVIPWNSPDKIFYVNVANIRNFTFFNSLATPEKDWSWVFHLDLASSNNFPAGEVTSSIVGRPNGSNEGYLDPFPPPPLDDIKTYPANTTLPYYRYYVGNNKSLDNVMIIRRDAGPDSALETTDDRLLCQTNKIVSLVPNPLPNILTQRGQEEIPGRMRFGQGLYYSSYPEDSMIKCWTMDVDMGGQDEWWVNQPIWNRRFGLFDNMTLQILADLDSDDPPVDDPVLYTVIANYSPWSGPLNPQAPAGYNVNPHPPSYNFYSDLQFNRPVSYQVIQFVTVPRTNGTTFDIY
jgi:type II secretory pathway pseudopilin PulG